MTTVRPEAVFPRLLTFLEHLERANISYTLHHIRNSLMIQVYVAEGVWEIEFFADGTLEAELFARGAGGDAITSEWLDQLVADNSD